MARPVSAMKTAGAIRWVLPVLLAAGLVAFFALGLQRYLSFRALAENREWLLRTVAQHQAISVLAFIGIYALAAALSVPGATILTIAGGFLFGIMAGAVYAVIGATIGASILFLAARSAFGASLRSRADGFVQKLAAGFERNALGYLLFLRLVPVFPFWLVNLVPAFLGVSLRIFVVGTFFGIIPGTLVFASIGAGLGELLDRGEAPDLRVIFAPRILLPLLGLALLALVPAAYDRLAHRAKLKEQARG